MTTSTTVSDRSLLFSALKRADSSSSSTAKRKASSVSDASDHGDGANAALLPGGGDSPADELSSQVFADEAKEEKQVCRIKVLETISDL